MLLTVENESGRGTMCCYEALPGALLVYHDFKMGSCYQKVEPVRGFLQINHCRSGCFEFELAGGARSFIGEGDLAVNNPEILTVVNSRFPLRRYEGIMIMLELESASEWLKQNASWTDLDLYGVKEKLKKYGDVFLMRANTSIGHIFDEFYQVDERIRRPYSILKIAELLLYLSLVSKEEQRHLPRFSPQVVEGTKQVYAYLSQNPLSRLTLAELSARFRVAQTSLKSCFKAIYGQTPCAFVRAERIQIGARLLVEDPEMTIQEVALQAGYENPSKFARAFHAKTNETPFVYRNRRMVGD